VVQLRVDVEAARARSEFNATSRTVNGFRSSIQATQRAADDLGDELATANARLAQSTRVFDAAEHAADDAADEVRRLQAQIAALGGPAPQHLVDQLQQAEDTLRDAEREEQRALDTMGDLADEANRVQRACDDAADEVRRLTRELAVAAAEADRLRRAMNDADRRANNPLRGAQRGLLGFRRQLDNALQLNGNGLRNSLREAWNTMPIELKLAIVGAGVGMATILAGAIGSVLNAALLGVVGLGVLGAVVAVAAKTSNAVQAAFSDTFRPITSQIAEFAREVGEGPLIKSAKIFGDTWHDISADVRDLFKDAGEHIEPLASDLAQLVENVMPGLREGLQAAGPVLDELAASLPAIGTAISDMFHDLSEDGAAQGAVKGMRVLAATVIATFRTIGAVVGWLSRQFNTTTMFVADMLTLLSHIPVIGKMFEGAAASARDFANAGSGTGRVLGETAEAADDASTAMYRQSAAARKAGEELYNLTRRLGELLDLELGVADANINWEQTWDDLTRSVQENGRSLDIHTEKGRANMQALRDSADAARQKFEADIAAAGGASASAEATAAATQKYLADLGALREHARALGLDTTKIDEVIAAYQRMAAQSDIHKTITVERKLLGPALGPAFGFRGLASGTKSAPPGLTWVGEIAEGQGQRAARHHVLAVMSKEDFAIRTR